MLHIAICDDDIPITTEVESMLLNISRKDYIKMEIDIYFDGKPLYRKIKEGTYYDLIYMDIEMNDINGIQAARLIRSKNIPSILIYISAYDTYFEQLFEVEPFRFIPKPIDFYKFYTYFKAAYKKINQDTKFFTFSFHQKYTKLPVSEIIYFESCGRDIIIHTLSGHHRFLGKLDNLELYMKNHSLDFIRIHQSYLVNPYHITSITLSNIELKNDCHLRISPKFQKQVHLKYLQIFEDL